MSSIGQRSYDSLPPLRVAFLGLGVMGFPMAGHLAKAGHGVVAYNRTPAKAQAWVAEFGGSRPPRRVRRPRAPTSSSAASATTPTCVPSCWAPTAPSPA